MVLGFAVALSLLYFVIAPGCGESDGALGDEEGKVAVGDPGRTLSRADLATVDFPVYWVGPVYRGLKVTDMRGFGKRGVLIAYGKQSCDPDSGCSYPMDVFSAPDRKERLPDEGETPDGFGGVCFRRIERAIQVSCLNAKEEDGEDVLLTGEGSVVFNSIDPADLRSATPPRGRLPQPPTRLTCGEKSTMPNWARSKVPRSLATPRRCY
jgi:hypothetical protein